MTATAASFDVSVVGLVILDVLARPVTAIPPGGGVTFVEQIRLTVAGTAGGTAVDLAKLGLRTRAVGAVVDDEKGRFVLDTLGGFGIDTAAMQLHAGVPTSASILSVRPNGDRPCFHVRGASDALLLGPEHDDAVLAAPVVHLGGSGLLAAMDGAPTARLLAEAKRRGAITTFDLLFATASLMDKLRPALPHIDYFIPSVEEATALCGRDEPADAARFFLDEGVDTCILTMGREGCLVANADTIFRLPAHAIDVVDTTGCGDAFTAGVIAALHRGWDIERAARLGGACGALVAGGLGSDHGITDWDGAVRAMDALRLRPRAD